MTECWYAKPAARPTMEGVYTSIKSHFDGGGSAGGDLYYDENEMAEMEEEFYDEACAAKASRSYAHWKPETFFIFTL